MEPSVHGEKYETQVLTTHQAFWVGDEDLERQKLTARLRRAWSGTDEQESKGIAETRPEMFIYGLNAGQSLKILNFQLRKHIWQKP